MCIKNMCKTQCNAFCGLGLGTGSPITPPSWSREEAARACQLWPSGNPTVRSGPEQAGFRETAA